MTQRVVNYTYGTGNPVLPDGSIDVRDGIDNLQSFDVFMNAEEDTYNQRDGQIVQTATGAVKSLGFKPGSGDFTTGFTVQPGQRDYAWYDPVSLNWYSYMGAIPSPSGHPVDPRTNPAVGADWKPVTDHMLRDDLADIDGGSLVGGATYSSIRAYSGSASRIKCIGRIHLFDNANGDFSRVDTDTISADNGGTILVDALGRRWKRQYAGLPSVLWWGAVPDWNGTTGTDNTAALQAAHNSHAVIFYPTGAYKTGPVTLSLSGAALVGPGTVYGRAEIAYTGSGTLFTCQSTVDYVTFRDSIHLRGVPTVATAYYNTGSVAIDTTAGSVAMVVDGCWIGGFETLFKSNYNSFYNRIENNRLEKFRYGLFNFSSNNLHVLHNRIQEFNTAIRANGGNGPLVVNGNAFEVFNGQIIEMTGAEQGVAEFTNNYVELYDNVDLPTNFPPSSPPNVSKFGGNFLFTGPFAVFINKGNDLQIGGALRYFSASTHVDYIESTGNLIHIFTTGNNIDKIWSAPSVGRADIHDDLAPLIPGSGGYARTYTGGALTQQTPNKPYHHFDPIAGKEFRALVEVSTLGLVNGWTSPDTSHGVAKVNKKNGVVSLSGIIDGSAKTGIVAFTIPVNYRPDVLGTTRSFANFSCHANYGEGSTVRFRYLYDTGEFRVEGSPASLAQIPLDGITIPIRT